MICFGYAVALSWFGFCCWWFCLRFDCCVFDGCFLFCFWFVVVVYVCLVCVLVLGFLIDLVWLGNCLLLVICVFISRLLFDVCLLVGFIVALWIGVLHTCFVYY